MFVRSKWSDQSSPVLQRRKKRKTEREKCKDGEIRFRYRISLKEKV